MQPRGRMRNECPEKSEKSRKRMRSWAREASASENWRHQFALQIPVTSSNTMYYCLNDCSIFFFLPCVPTTVKQCGVLWGLSFVKLISLRRYCPPPFHRFLYPSARRRFIKHRLEARYCVLGPRETREREQSPVGPVDFTTTACKGKLQSTDLRPSKPRARHFMGLGTDWLSKHTRWNKSECASPEVSALCYLALSWQEAKGKVYMLHYCIISICS